MIILLLTFYYHVSLLIYRLFLWMYPAALKLVSPWNAKARRPNK